MADLSIGAMGSDVMRNQYALNLAGKSLLPALDLDGFFGPKTQARLKEFQRNNGLTPDGVIGQLTRAKLGTAGPIPGEPATPAHGAGQTDDQLARSIALATKAAVGHWQANARFGRVIINGAMAVAPPGCLSGPALFGSMSPWLGALHGEDKAIGLAAARGISDAFERWQKSVAIPGLLWYPQFAAFPGGTAPPTPNIPTPLFALASTSELIFDGGLAQAMKHATGPSPSQRATVVFAKASDPLARAFVMYLSMTMVMGVLGQGPVPTFAPPKVPAGPVVGGTVASTPGVLSGPGLMVF
jgi:hypothetical protein